MATNTATDPVEATLTINQAVYNPINKQTWFSILRKSRRRDLDTYIVENLLPKVATKVVDLLEEIQEEATYKH